MSHAVMPLLVAAGIGASAVACGGGSDAPRDTPRPTLTLIPELASPRPTTLSERQPGTGMEPGLAEITEDAVRTDPAVARLVADSLIVGISSGQWYWGDDPETGKSLIVATTATVKLGSPIDHESIELPDIGRRSDYYHLWPDDLQQRYDFFTHGTVTYRLRNITQFEVKVDFYTRKVIDFLFLPSEGEVAEVIAPTIDPDILDDLRSFDENSDEVRAIVERDPRLAGLLEEADQVSAFSGRFGENNIGQLSAHFDRSVTTTGDFPVFVDRDYKTGDYRSVIVTMNETYTRQLMVWVDLDREEIISVEPDEGD